MKKIKCILQHDSTDCGAACLAMISYYYGLKIPITKIREYASTTLKGTNVLGLKEAGEKLGFNVKAVKGKKEDLNKSLSTPFIAHVNKNGNLHYIVIYKIKKKYLIVSDPAKGKLKISKIDFYKEWTGILILLAPAEEFIKGNEKQSMFQKFYKYIKNSKRMLCHIIVGTLINTLLGLIASYYFKYLIDDILANKLKSTLITFTIGLIFLNFFKLLLSTFRSYLIYNLGQKINYRILTDFYNHVITLPMSFFKTRKIGEITSRINDGGIIIGTMIQTIFTLIIDSIMLFSVGLLLLTQNRKLFFLSLIFIPIYLFLTLVFIKPFKKYNREILEESSQLGSYLLESLNGIETIKALNGEEDTITKYKNDYLKVVKKGYKFKYLSMLSSFLESVFSIFSNNYVYFIGGLEIIKGNISVGDLLTFNTLFGMFFGSIINFFDLILSFQKSQIASERLGEILDIEPENFDGEVIKKLDGDIKIENLYFSYDNTKETLSNINLEIKKGQKVGIVGESGSGKSTLIKLLMRYYRPTKGKLLINNTELETINLGHFRREISYLPQETFLFSGTIVDNLKFGFKDIKDFQIIEACKKAKINEFVEKQPSKYQYKISENGRNLSGGQRQRIALARFFLKNSNILILDEMANGLDVNTRIKINREIEEISKNKTLIQVAHYLPTIKKYDKIIVMNNGKIVEVGAHEELLLDETGHYRKLWKLQVGEENE